MQDQEKRPPEDPADKKAQAVMGACNVGHHRTVCQHCLVDAIQEEMDIAASWLLLLETTEGDLKQQLLEVRDTPPKDLWARHLALSRDLNTARIEVLELRETLQQVVDTAENRLGKFTTSGNAALGKIRKLVHDRLGRIQQTPSE